MRLDLFGERGQVSDAAENIGILHDNTAGAVINLVEQAVAIGCAIKHRHLIDQIILGKFRHRLRDRNIVRMETRGENRLAALGDPPGHGDRFPAGGRAVVHRGIGDIDPEQTRHLGLEFEQGLQRALRDFRLIRGVSGEKLAPLDDMVDAGRDMVAIGPCPQEERHVACGVVLFCQRLHMRFHRHLARVHRQALDRAGQPGFLRHIDEQIVNRLRADLGQHRLPVFGSQREITHSVFLHISPSSFSKEGLGGLVPPVAARAMLTQRHHPLDPLL